jgi:hypothetical protein
VNGLGDCIRHEEADLPEDLPYVVILWQIAASRFNGLQWVVEKENS